MTDTVLRLRRRPASERGKAFRADLLARDLPAPGRYEPPAPTSADRLQATFRSEQSRKEAARNAFAELYWPPEITLSWIAWRVVERVLDDWRPATWYNGVARPQRLLLSALKKGALKAFDRNGSQLPPERWAFVTEADLADEIVRFARADIVALWRSLDETDKTKSQGRPYKSKLFIAEHDRRCVTGVAKYSLVEEVDCLLDWFSQTHPDKIGQAAKAGTIRNNVRKRHAEYVSAATK